MNEVDLNRYSTIIFKPKPHEKYNITNTEGFRPYIENPDSTST